MRILLTGTSGQVGGALEKALHRPEQILTPGRRELDLSDPASLPAALDSLAPELIINPAAYTAVDRAEDEADIAFRVNAEAPSVIARWSARHGVPLVHFSTDYVFGGSGDRPWREDDLCEPLSVYGKSKFQGEVGVRDAGGVHLIVRTSWVYSLTGQQFLPDHNAAGARESRIASSQRPGRSTDVSAIDRRGHCHVAPLRCQRHQRSLFKG